MKTLYLQINKESFDAILNGSQTIENRWVYPSNKSTFFDIAKKGNPDAVGITPHIDDIYSDNPVIVFDTHGTVLGEPKEYDALRLVNGRRDGAPELTIEVLDVEPEVNTNDDDEPYLIEDRYRGKKLGCLALSVNYHLGKILETKNI